MRILLLAPAALALAVTMSPAKAEDFERQVAADPHGAVEISNVSGTVSVTAWDRPQVNVRASYGSGVERVEVSSDHGRTLIKVILPHFQSHGGDADVHVQIPQDSELDVTTVSADINSRGVRGTQRLKAVSGDIEADIGAADIEVKTVSGEISLRGTGQPGQIHLTTISGDVRLEHGAGDLEANSVSGTLQLSLDTTRSVRVRTTSGDLRFQGKLMKGGSFDAETVSGDVTVHAASEAGFEYEARSFSGDITDCFHQQAENTSAYGPGKRLAGTRGENGGHVRLKSMSGDINLCDRS